MTAVDSAVREFSITFYPPSTANTVFLAVTALILLVACTWFGLRLGLHLFGAKTEGRVVDSRVKIETVQRGGLQGWSRLYSSKMKIEFTDADGEKHTLRGSSYSSGGKDEIRVGNAVPVFYSRTFPSIATFYDPIWHYIAPLALLGIAAFFTYWALINCHNDIRNTNFLALNDSTREDRHFFHQVITESDLILHDDTENAAIYERRGDAKFAALLLREAIVDYSEALRLRPDDRDLLRKRAKAQWLEGLDRDALRDWRRLR